MLVDGRPVLVPAGIGINVDDPGVQRSFEPRAFGGIELCERPCYVDGRKHDGDPREILLTDRKEIAIVIGTPPAEVPESYDFSNA